MKYMHADIEKERLDLLSTDPVKYQKRLGGKSTHLEVHLLYKILHKDVKSKHIHTNQVQ